MRSYTSFVLKTIASIEELRDIPADILVKHESTSWMKIPEASHIEHHIIKNDKLLA
jgi:hypothetical protein